jgi:hypothetical protein
MMNEWLNRPDVTLDHWRKLRALTYDRFIWWLMDALKPPLVWLTKTIEKIR